MEELKFSTYKVEVEPNNLKFDETTLSEYIQKEGGYYDYFGAYLSLAEKNLQNKEILHDRLYNERFIEAKEYGAAVALAEAKAKIDPVVCALQDEVVDAKYIVNRLKQHLRAWDKNHDNAQSLGHMLRKQMDKLNGDIRTSHGDFYSFNGTPGLDNEIDSTVPAWGYEKKEEENSGNSGFETNLSSENLF